MDFWLILASFFVEFSMIFAIVFGMIFGLIFNTFRSGVSSFFNVLILWKSLFFRKKNEGFTIHLTLKHLNFYQNSNQMSIHFRIFFHYFSWLFRYRFLHGFLHGFFMENGSNNHKFWNHFGDFLASFFGYRALIDFWMHFGWNVDDILVILG